MEFGPSLAHSIIERVGARKEAWLVFDMDETLAHWSFSLKKANAGNKDMPAADFYEKHTRQGKTILRPTVIPFLRNILESGIAINFAIYSNSHKADRVEFIARTIENALGNDPRFHVCFLFHNKFAVAGPGVQRLNKNMEGVVYVHKANKTIASIRYGYEQTGHPIKDEDMQYLFFFDDNTEYSDIRAAIGRQYYVMSEFRGNVQETAPVGRFGSRWGGRRGHLKTHSAKKRVTRRRSIRRAL